MRQTRHPRHPRHSRHSRRWLALAALAALGGDASCTFQPGRLMGGADVDGGSTPDARVIPDARPSDAGRAPDAAQDPDAGSDAAIPDAAVPIDGPPPGLVAHWPFDLIEGGPVRTTPDVVGGFDGEVRGGAAIVPGMVGGAISLDGTGAFVRIDDVAQLDFTGAITLAAWCRPGAINGTRNIVVHGTPPMPDEEVYLRIANNSEYQAGSWTGPGSTSDAKFSVPAGDVGQWVHLAAVYDGATWRLYRNGDEVATGGTVGAVSVNAPWGIGGRANTPPDRLFTGEIDDVRIYQRALTVPEIQALASPAAALTP